MSKQAYFHRMRYLAQRGLLFLGKGARYAWVFILWQTNRWARQVGLRRQPWLMDESAFWAQLDLNMQSLAKVAAAVRSRDEEGASCALLDYFCHRETPRFFFDWSDRSRLLDLIGPGIRAATIDAADQAVRRTFCFRGQPPITFDGRVDWTYQPQDNTDWMWDLNRHLYFITLGQALWYTGDARYAQAFSDLLTDWLERNSADEHRPNWASPFEVACRINTWLWAYHLFLSAGALDAATHLALLQGLWTHGVYLDAYLELHVPNNHLLLEAKALAMLGLLLPEFRAARRWRQRGLDILEREVNRQVCSDGVHVERVPHYHRLIAGELLELLVLLDNNALSMPPVLVNGFRRMLEFERHITRPDGRIPLFGDSAHGDPYVRLSPLPGGAALLGLPDLKLLHADVDEMTTWLLGPERVKRFYDLPAQPPDPSRSFPEGGYVVIRDSWEANGLYLAFDCGPFGYQLSAGHGHADALSLELYAHGHPQLVDSGVYSFQLGDRWRNAFRGTRAHNTVVVDEQDQSRLLDSWRVWRPAQVTLNDWATGHGFDFVDASHNGYRRLPGKIIHRRQVFFVKPEYWIVFDLLDGQGQHRFDLYFHLTCDAKVSLDPVSGTARARHDEGTGLLICPVQITDSQAEVITGGLNPIQGWTSRYSGEKTPAPTLRYTKTTSAPTQFGTVLYPCARVDETVVDVSPLAVTDQEQGHLGAKVVTGLKIEVGPWIDYFVVDRRERPSRKVFDGYVADGELVYVRTRSADGAPVRTILHRGSQLELDGAPLIANGKDSIIRKPLEPGLYAAGG